MPCQSQCAVGDALLQATSVAYVASQGEGPAYVALSMINIEHAFESNVIIFPRTLVPLHAIVSFGSLEPT